MGCAWTSDYNANIYIVYALKNVIMRIYGSKFVFVSIVRCYVDFIQNYGVSKYCAFFFFCCNFLSDEQGRWIQTELPIRVHQRPIILLCGCMVEKWLEVYISALDAVLIALLGSDARHVWVHPIFAWKIPCVSFFTRLNIIRLKFGWVWWWNTSYITYFCSLSIVDAYAIGFCIPNNDHL